MTFMLDIVFIDVETTGLYPQNGEKIVEIGAYRRDLQGREYFFQRLINPGKSIPLNVQYIHNIDDEMVREAPFIEDIAEEFLSFLGRSIIGGYNLNFDLSFVESYFPREFFKSHTFIDVYKMVKTFFPEFGSFSLGNVCAYLGIDFPKKHRALEDAHATGKLFFKCLGILEKRNISFDEIKDKSQPTILEQIL